MGKGMGWKGGWKGMGPPTPSHHIPPPSIPPEEVSGSLLPPLSEGSWGQDSRDSRLAPRRGLVILRDCGRPPGQLGPAEWKGQGGGS